MKRIKKVTKTLYIEELERPQIAVGVTTLAMGEESGGGGFFRITTLAIGEEAK